MYRLKFLALLVAFTLVFGGCVYRGAKITEGTDLAVGLNVPSTEGTLQLQLLNYLSGFRMGVATNAALTLRYTVAETNSYFGAIRTQTTKTIDATVSPCSTSANVLQ